MEWKDLASKFFKFAPMVGTVLGGPAGAAAGGLISIIGNAFGLTPEETTPEKINHLLATDPQAAIKMAEIEANNKVELQKMILEQERIRLADVASARAREVEITKATGKRDINLYILSYLFIIGFFVSIITMLVLSLSGKLPESMPDYVVFLLGSLFGTLTSGTGAVIQYFFGSSMGSSKKSEFIEKIEKKQSQV